MNMFRNYNLLHNRIGGNSSKASEESPVYAVTGVILTLLFGITVGWAGSIYADYKISQKIAALEINTAAGRIKNSHNRIINAKKSADIFGVTQFSKGALPAVKQVSIAQTPLSTPTTPVAQSSSIIASAPGQEGVIYREVINNLLMNPFDEMKRFRIRPKYIGNESVGIEVQWIQNDSVLTKLGVQKGDVIKSLNGIPLKNMGDITNAINLLMNGTMFDVEVLRGDTPINLVYAVVDDAGQSVSIAPTPTKTPTTPLAQSSSIIASAPGQEEVIYREVISNLLNNPFDEIKRFRIRPKFVGNEPVGLEFQWIQNDSVLTKLGIKKGDVMKSMNGIPMKNIGDISNVINSLMNGKMFDVEVLRGDAPIHLVYSVVDDAGQSVSIAPTPTTTPTTPLAKDSRIISANSETVQEWIIERGINDRRTDPFDEMKRYRVRPKFIGNEPIGIEVQWVQNDGILAKLGIQKGDVIKSFNGIPLKNMGDISNAMDSLINGTRTDIEIKRGDATINYKYVVK